MEKNKILLIDMYGVIIKESKGYFIPYTLQRFDTSEHGRIISIIRDEQCFTKAQRGELSNEQFCKAFSIAGLCTSNVIMPSTPRCSSSLKASEQSSDSHAFLLS